METPRDVRVGLIGVGHMGRHHARVLAALPGVRLSVVCDANDGRARAAAAQYGALSCSEAERLPADLDAVVLATPSATHFALAKRFLGRGMSCFVEKPLTETVEEAEVLTTLAQEKGVVLQVGHIERFNPAVVEMIRQTHEPLFIEANRLGPYDPRVAQVGVVMDLMIHDLDIVLALVRDRLTRVDAVGGSVLSSREDIVKVTLHFAKGCRADISASRVTVKPFRKIRVFQPDAYLSLDYSDRSLTVYRKKKPVITSLRDISISKPKLEKKDPLETELRHFVQCVRDGGTPAVTGEHGRNALELALEIQRSLRVHRVGG